jgi:hypothetical protein
MLSLVVLIDADQIAMTERNSRGVQGITFARRTQLDQVLSIPKKKVVASDCL